MLPDMEGDISKDILNVPRWDDRSPSSPRGTFDMSPDIEGNIYDLIPKVNNYEIRPMIWTFRP
jgi:hypothetical protein